MKKVLLIANLFHASPRIPGITVFLPEFGWQATVITPPVDERARQVLGLSDEFFAKTIIVDADYPGDIFWFWRKICTWLGLRTDESITQQIKKGFHVKSKKSIIDRLLIFYQEIFGYPDSEKTWISSALNAAVSCIEKERFDAMISSSPYPTSHIVAAKITRRFGIPWVADFRDPWTENPNFLFGSIRKFFERRLEQKVMRMAKKITAVAPAYAEATARINNRRVEVITNGFDPAIVNDPPKPLTKKFTITYTGTLYQGKRDPKNLFIALRDILESGEIAEKEIEIRFYGKHQSWLQAEIEKYGLGHVAMQKGQLPRLEVLQKQYESQILLLLGWGSEDSPDAGVYPGKIFEYFAARRPILVVGGPENETIKKIVEQTGAGKGMARADDVKKILLEYYDEYQTTSTIAFRGNLEKIDEFNNRNIAEKVVRVLFSATNEKDC
ncbi:glycosyltransferase [Candidatus Uhrbacteria bacterium]|nr:glycosyltransferase [Candidatus Uhrbacteria bacterium]